MSRRDDGAYKNLLKETNRLEAKNRKRVTNFQRIAKVDRIKKYDAKQQTMDVMFDKKHHDASFFKLKEEDDARARAMFQEMCNRRNACRACQVLTRSSVLMWCEEHK